MNKYKLRAECLSDVFDFLKSTEVISFSINTIMDYASDVELTFFSCFPIFRIKEILDSIPDSHVMRETIEKADNYTGERENEINCEKYYFQINLYRKLINSK